MLSNQYSISNGVKQGGCLSPTLFSIYLNDLIDVLRSSNIDMEMLGIFMNKYDISRDDWNSPINILYNKIDLYSTQHTFIDDICVATLIRELCESRDSEYTKLL